MLLYAFLVQRSIDPEPWPMISKSKAQADAYPQRVSDVFELDLVRWSPAAEKKHLKKADLAAEETRSGPRVR